MHYERTDTQALVRRYFAVKAEQLRASADLPVCEHSGLIGSHREELQRIYLREILPQRFGVGRGMVYSAIGTRSKESDIVIWDAQNYPSLPLLDHSLFFAEAVRLVVECKSTYSTGELEDVRAKAEAVKSIIAMQEPGLAETIQMLIQDVHALREGLSHEGALITPHHIASAAIFLRGGATLTADAISDDDLQNSIDRSWPDVMLLLEPGRVFIKNYDTATETYPTLEVFDVGDDVLLVFTDAFLRLLACRSLQRKAVSICGYTATWLVV